MESLWDRRRRPFGRPFGLSSPFAFHLPLHSTHHAATRRSSTRAHSHNETKRIRTHQLNHTTT